MSIRCMDCNSPDPDIDTRLCDDCASARRPSEIGMLINMIGELRAKLSRQSAEIEALEVEAQAVAFELAANWCEQWAIVEKNQDAEHAYEQAGLTFENKAKSLRNIITPTKTEEADRT